MIGKHLIDLTDAIIRKEDIAWMDAVGGADYALRMVELLGELEEAGWRFVPPED